MTESITKTKIQKIIAAVNQKRDILADYQQKLNDGKAELEQAKRERKDSFTFETDNKVVELESYVSRIEQRRTQLEQEFESELPEQLRRVEELFDAYVIEKWGADEAVQTLTSQVVESFKNTVQLLDQYTKKPAEIKKQAMNEVRDAEFKRAFSGQMSLIGMSNFNLANAIPMGVETYQTLYEVGRQLGVSFE